MRTQVFDTGGGQVCRTRCLIQVGARLRVNDHVEVALAVALVRVGEALPLVRQRTERLRQHLHLRG